MLQGRIDTHYCIGSFIERGNQTEYIHNIDVLFVGWPAPMHLTLDSWFVWLLLAVSTSPTVWPAEIFSTQVSDLNTLCVLDGIASLIPPSPLL